MTSPRAHHDLLGRLSAGVSLTQDETADAVDGIMSGAWSEGEIALFLTGLAEKGETVEELAGAARAMRRHMQRIRTSRTGVVDTCGTGGTGSTIFNVSTTAALVVAATGVPVAKHGNRKVTSRCGSADVLAELGVNIQADVRTVEACLDELGICFCFAPLMHAAMKHVAPVRQKLGIRTIFNLLGPASNPAGAPFQLLGVGRADLMPLLAGALALLDTERTTVVCGDDGLGEVTIGAGTKVRLVSRAAAGEPHLTSVHTWTPGTFGLPQAPSLAPLSIDSPAAGAAIVRDVLAGKPGPARDIVVANAAAALWTAGKFAALREAARAAERTLDVGAAAELLRRLVERSHA